MVLSRFFSECIEHQSPFPCSPDFWFQGGANPKGEEQSKESDFPEKKSLAGYLCWFRLRGVMLIPGYQFSPRHFF
jgi:hypothetical protein